MLQELVEKLLNTGKALGTPKVIKHPGSDQIYFLISGDEVKELPPLATEHKGLLRHLDSLIAYAKEHVESVIFVGDESVSIHLDRNHRSDLMVLPLMPSEVFKAITRADKVKGSPADIRRMLRVELGVSTTHPLYVALGAVDFSRTSEGSYRAEHGKESLGRSVEDKVQSVEEIPESFEIVFPMFAVDGIDFTAAVSLQVYIDAQQRLVELFALPDAIQSARRRALDYIHERIAEKVEVPVYRGQIQGAV